MSLVAIPALEVLFLVTSILLASTDFSINSQLLP